MASARARHDLVEMPNTPTSRPGRFATVGWQDDDAAHKALQVALRFRFVQKSTWTRVPRVTYEPKVCPSIGKCSVMSP